MTDAHGHMLTNFQRVRYDEDVEAAGKDALVEVLREVNWKTEKVFWCPTCKAWSVQK